MNNNLIYGLATNGRFGNFNSALAPRPLSSWLGRWLNDKIIARYTNLYSPQADTKTQKYALYRQSSNFFELLSDWVKLYTPHSIQ